MDRSRWIGPKPTVVLYRDQLRHHEVFLGGHVETSCPCISCHVVLFECDLNKLLHYVEACVSQADEVTVIDDDGGSR